MDSFEFNKIAGGVLSALLIAFGSGTLIDILHGGHDAHEKPGYTLEVKTASANEGAGAAAAPAFDPAAIVSQIAKADPKIGAGVFARCKACHLTDKSGKSSPTAPNLWDIVGRNLAASTTYTKYSSAMKSKGGSWDYQSLASYLHSPRKFIPGNRMAFAGITDDGQLAALIAYLRTLSDQPKPLP